MFRYTANLWLSYLLLNGNTKEPGLDSGGNCASDNKAEKSVYCENFALPVYADLNATVFYEHKK
jgi:hypothetical protein